MPATRLILLAVAAAIVLTQPGSSQAQHPEGPYGLHGGYHANVNWPEPYCYADRAAISAPFAVMIRKGWQEQNMVGTHHFKSGTSELNEAGQVKVQWVVTQAPIGFRSVWVESGSTPEETAARVAATRKMAQRFALDGEQVEVHRTNNVSRGWPAEYIVKINEMYLSSTPDPHLGGSSSAAGTGSPAGGSGSGSGGGGK